MTRSETLEPKKTDLELIEKASGYLAEKVVNELEKGKKVLLFVTGGSSIAVAVEASKKIKEKPGLSLENLTVTLTDERYGPENHPDSNWAQLKKQGFSIPNAKLSPILDGETRDKTVKRFNEFLEKAFQEAEYKIGLFGVGVDGHTAGMLPKSGAVDSQDLAYGYDGGKFERVTVTPKAIRKLDKAVVFMQGKEKKEMAKKLMNEEMADLRERPAQILTEIESKIYND